MVPLLSTNPFFCNKDNNYVLMKLFIDRMHDLWGFIYSLIIVNVSSRGGGGGARAV